MNAQHLDRICCIHCGGELRVTSRDKVVENGLLECVACGTQFPVIKYIPRLLSGKLLWNCLEFYGDVVMSNPELFTYRMRVKEVSGVARGGQEEIVRLKEKTNKTFSYEWNIWNKLPDFAQNHFLEVMRKEARFFEGDYGWDPAIGIGRDLTNSLEAIGCEGFMIGSDLSYSVDIAYVKCGDAPNVLIVQADLYSPFIRENSLDFAYMIGLIQHLTEPRKGIEEVYSKVKSGGYFAGTVYEKPKTVFAKLLVGGIRFMRVITTKLPLRVVYWISRLFAIPSYLFFKLPRCLLERTRYAREMEDQYPTHQTQKGRPDFNLLVHNWFDHFTPPIIGFYSEEEILAMLKDCPLEDMKLKYGIFGGFKT